MSENKYFSVGLYRMGHPEGNDTKFYCFFERDFEKFTKKNSSLARVAVWDKVEVSLAGRINDIAAHYKRSASRIS